MPTTEALGRGKDCSPSKQDFMPSQYNRSTGVRRIRWRLTWGLVWVLFVIELVSAQSVDSSPTVVISVYGAAQQNAPVRVVGLRYNYDEIAVDLLNTSEKTVSAAKVVATTAVPVACNVGQDSVPLATGFRLSAMRIESGQTRTSPRGEAPLTPAALVLMARDQKTAYLLVQAAVVEVDFTDGTKWTLPFPYVLPVDSALVKAQDHACSEPDKVTRILSTVQRVGWKKDASAQMEQVQVKGAAIVPHLVFGCSFAEANAEALCPETSRVVGTPH